RNHCPRTRIPGWSWRSGSHRSRTRTDHRSPRTVRRPTVFRRRPRPGRRNPRNRPARPRRRSRSTASPQSPLPPDTPRSSWFDAPVVLVVVRIRSADGPFDRKGPVGRSPPADRAPSRLVGAARADAAVGGRRERALCADRHAVLLQVVEAGRHLHGANAADVALRAGGGPGGEAERTTCTAGAAFAAITAQTAKRGEAVVGNLPFQFRRRHDLHLGNADGTAADDRHAAVLGLDLVHGVVVAGDALLAAGLVLVLCVGI